MLRNVTKNQEIPALGTCADLGRSQTEKTKRTQSDRKPPTLFPNTRNFRRCAVFKV
jgi:hypothetical protein